MKTLWHGLLAIVLACSIGAAHATDDGILTAKQAYDKAQAGEIVLIDVRSPGEWQQTGVPQGGVAETIHSKGGLPSFATALLARLDGDKATPVALICATGKRSAYTRRYLEQAGFTNVRDVSEGMMGSSRGAGWHRRGLPIKQWTPE